MVEIESLKPIEHNEIGGVSDINTLKKVLIFLIGNLKTEKYKTEIIKLCFILDYNYCKKFEVNIGPTTVEYIKYTYGPYSSKFIEAFDQLTRDGILVEINLPFGIGYTIKKQQEVSLDERIKETIKEVVEVFGDKSLKELRTFIYEKNEFKQTDFGKPINFN